MSKQKKTQLVYSTDRGRLCPQCLRAALGCVCGKDRPASTGDGIVRLRRETKGRGGKAVTIINGLPLASAELKKLAKSLKQQCGVGGAIKDADIEIQGDQRELLKQALEKLGYTVKQAGG
jgi:translation initiation factor 1